MPKKSDDSKEKPEVLDLLDDKKKPSRRERQRQVVEPEVAKPSALDTAKAIRANQSVEDVRAALIKAMAEADEHTNNAPPARGSQTAGQSGVLSAKAVYEKRAARKQNSRKGN